MKGDGGASKCDWNKGSFQVRDSLDRLFSARTRWKGELPDDSEFHNQLMSDSDNLQSDTNHEITKCLPNSPCPEKTIVGGFVWQKKRWGSRKRKHDMSGEAERYISVETVERQSKQSSESGNKYSDGKNGSAARFRGQVNASRANYVYIPKERKRRRRCEDDTLERKLRYLRYWLGSGQRSCDLGKNLQTARIFCAKYFKTPLAKSPFHPLQNMSSRFHLGAFCNKPPAPLHNLRSLPPSILIREHS